MVKRFFLAVILTAFSVISFAQEVKEVTLVVNGDGATKEEATHVALRSAIEQAFGTFVSANTTILNDELVKDEIATVSSGNIQSYTELSSYTLSNGNTSVSLQATVSIGKLVTYAKSKGSECEFAGATFGMNVKMLKLKYENTEKAFANLVQYIKEVGPSVFDKKISASEPQIPKGMIDYEVKLTVSFDTNANTFAFYNHVMSTMRAIVLNGTEEEQLEAVLGHRYVSNHIRHCESLGYYPICNGKDLTSYLDEYCLGHVISTNLGELTRNIRKENQSKVDWMCSRNGGDNTELAELLYKRMFDYFLMHENDSQYKDNYLKKGFYAKGGLVRYENDDNVYIWKQNMGYNGNSYSVGKKICVDGYYQVPLPSVVYRYKPSVDELSKITGFSVK